MRLTPFCILRFALLSLSSLLLANCGKFNSTSTTTSNPSETQDGISSCPVHEEPNANTTIFYVATNEAGASNELCDGLSPTNQGGGHCPFKDFSSDRTFYLLTNFRNRRVEVRAGLYQIARNGDPVDRKLSVQGTGTTESERISLAAYKNEAVIFDGDNATREVVHVSGQFVSIEGIVFQNAGAHNIAVIEGSNVHIQCNRFLRNFGSDSVKSAGFSHDVLVRNNEFTDWDSQALDLTESHHWTVENNFFHDSRAPQGQVVGTKKGAHDILVRNNQIKNTAGVNCGGTGSAHPEDFEATNITFEANLFDSIRGPVVKYYSCLNGVFRNNDVRGTEKGILLGGEAYEGPSQCHNGAGCLPTQGALVTGNRIKSVAGLSPDTFWGVYSSETVGLSASNNLYCFSQSPAKFVRDNISLDITGWKASTNVDLDSRVQSLSTDICANW